MRKTTSWNPVSWQRAFQADLSSDLGALELAVLGEAVDSELLMTLGDGIGSLRNSVLDEHLEANVLWVGLFEDSKGLSSDLASDIVFASEFVALAPTPLGLLGDSNRFWIDTVAIAGAIIIDMELESSSVTFGIH